MPPGLVGEVEQHHPARPQHTGGIGEELHGGELLRDPALGIGIEHHDVGAPVGELGDSRETVHRSHPDPVGSRQRQLAAYQRGQLGVRLEDDLRRPGALGVDIPGQREPGATDVRDPERAGRQRVDDRGEMGDVLEAEVVGVGQVDVGLGAAVHHHGHAAAAVLVRHELDPSDLVLWHGYKPRWTPAILLP